MYELNRVLLFGIGPKGARYTDVKLDFSGYGTQASKSAAGTARPAPTSLLLLENGGGKSVLLKLLFSVMVPGKRNTVGGTDLYDLHLDGDTGHVAIEWMHVNTGELLITGKVSERRSAGDRNHLDESWYLFRPSTALTLDTLPLTEDNRRRRLKSFQQALQEADREDPKTQLAWNGPEQRRWREQLSSVGIMQDLYQIQRGMNDDEGGAAASFTFKSSRDFVSWLLRTVTDPDTVAPVSDTFHTFSRQLAERELLLLEGEFLGEAATRLNELAQASAEHDEATHAATQARSSVDALADAVQARLTTERQAITGLEDGLEEAETAVKRQQQELRDAEAIQKEIALRTAQLALEVAQDAKTAVEADHKEAADRAEAWELLPLVNAHTAAQHTATALAAEVHKVDQDVTNALARRDEAAARLITKYHAAASDAATREQALRDAADEHQATATEVRQERSRAEAAKATAETKYTAARTLIESAQAATDVAIEHAVLPAGTHLRDVAGHSADAVHALEQADALLVETKTAWAAARAASAQARTGEKDATAALNHASERLDGANTALAQVLSEAETLSRHHLVTDLLSTDEEGSQAAPAGGIGAEMLAEAAGRICAHRAAEVRERVTTRDALGAEQSKDARILGALHNAGLLPARRQATTVAQALTDHGIQAHAGWHYLSEMVTTSLRRNVIARHPAAVDGVVVVDANRLDEARDILDRQLLLPDAAVWVGPATILTSNPDPVEAGDQPDGFVVETTPALYDLDAAEQWRDKLTERMSQRGQTIATLEQDNADAVELINALRAWAATNTAEHLETLRSDVTDAEAAQTTAQEADVAAQRHLAEAEDLESEAEAAVTTADQTLTHARAHQQQVAALERQAQAALDALADEPALLADIEVAQEKIEITTASETQAQTARTQALVDADRARDEAARHRAEANLVSSTSGQRHPNVPEEPIAVLRDLHKDAESIYRAAQTDTDLTPRLDNARTEVARLQSQLDVKNSGHVEAARQLRDEPSAADDTLWSSNATTAREHAVDLREQLDDCVAEVGRRDEGVTRAKPPVGRLTWADLPDHLVPADPQHGAELGRQQTLKVAERTEASEAANARKTTVQQQVHTARTAAEGFNNALTHLALRNDDSDLDGPAAPQAAQPPTPFDADGAAAVKGATAAAENLRSARKHVAATRAKLTLAAGRLPRLAQRPKYEPLAQRDHRRLLLESTPEALVARAVTMAEQLRTRKDVIDGELADVDRHRKTLVTRLAGLVGSALKTVNRASRFSTLPEELTGWGGQKFLRVGYAHPGPDELNVRVAETIDRLAADDVALHKTSRDGMTSRQREPISLLLECVHGAVPRGFRVEVLQPDAVLRNNTVRIEQMGDIFSGGQELTAAIVLYCTLAALKADELGHMRHKHSGVLFLDNPIGKANADYLIDVQKSFANALGVQLVYTTGLNDDRVLASFGQWIKLRNDADLKAGLKHLRVADELRQLLPEPYTDAELATEDKPLGTLTASRVTRKQPDSASGAEPLPANGMALLDEQDTLL